MAILLTERNGGKTLEVTASGRLTDEDYQQFVPEFERLAKQHGPIRVLFELTEFQGWNIQAAWDDLKFGQEHYRDIERLAVVGERKWQQCMAEFCNPFTIAEVHYFDRIDVDKARAWVNANDGLEEDPDAEGQRTFGRTGDI